MRSRRKKKKAIIDYDIEREAEFLNNKNIRKSIFKIGVVLLIICLNSTALFEIKTTLSYFSDKEESLGNIYNVGTLDFLLESLSDFSPSVFESNNLSVRNINVVKIGSLDFQYNIEALKISGDNELCDILQLEAILEGSLKYQGLLMDLNLDPMVIIGGDGQDNWVFKLSLPTLSIEELKSIRSKTCQFEFIFNAQQIDCPECSSGFLDTEKIVNNISTGDWNPEVRVIYPNGGEVWYMVPLGSEVPGLLGTYNIRWTASSPLYNVSELRIDIWFCKESGNNCFHKITSSGTTENDGSYWWTIPYNSAFITSEARMKIVAYDPDSFMGEDFSDEDFCPPMLSQQEVLIMLSLLRTVEKNLSEEPVVINQPEPELEPEVIPEEQEVVEEESVGQEQQIIEEVLVEEEIPIESESTETEIPAEELQSEPEPEIISEEEEVVEESQPEPETMPEEQEVVEEQPVDLPEEILINITDEADNGGDGNQGSNENNTSDIVISE